LFLWFAATGPSLSNTRLLAQGIKATSAAFIAMPDSTVYSLEGRNLKLTSREDIEPYIKEINAIEDLQEIHLGGNTLGVGACQALGETLKTKNNLKVSFILATEINHFITPPDHYFSSSLPLFRWPTLPTSLQVD
jgi:hypothetical protein